MTDKTIQQTDPSISTVPAVSVINEELLDFLEQCPTPYHTADTIRKTLLDVGYKELHESSSWTLKRGGHYFVMRGGSSIIAFRVPYSLPAGFMIAASHSDSPALKIKVNPEMKGSGYIRLNIEKYGGVLMQSWFDRPLSVAGRVIVRTDRGVKAKLVCIDRDLLMIPRLAIHMDRKQNDGQAINPQTDLLPILGQDARDSAADGPKDGASAFMSMVADAAGCDLKDLIGHDLFLYVRGRGTIWGAGREFVSGGHIDDLQCTFANLSGFFSAQESDSVPVFAVFDNEEIGSRTRQGADSTFLTDVLHRISLSLSWSSEQFLTAASNSFLISSDNAHALHPNYADKADPVNRPQINQGIVIKYSAVQRYSTDAVSAAIFKEICRKANVPFQEYTNRSDITGGSTLGHISTAHFSIPTADVGLPQLSMHSSFETAGTKDTAYLVRAAETFFSSTLRDKGNGDYELYQGTAPVSPDEVREI